MRRTLHTILMYVLVLFPRSIDTTIHTLISDRGNYCKKHICTTRLLLANLFSNKSGGVEININRAS